MSDENTNLANVEPAGAPAPEVDPDITPGFISAVSLADGSDAIRFETGESDDGNLWPTVVDENVEGQDTVPPVSAPESAPVDDLAVPPLFPDATPEAGSPEPDEVLQQRLQDQQSFFTGRENQLVEHVNAARSENQALREQLARIEGHLGIDAADEGTDPDDVEGTPNPALALSGPQLRQLIDDELGPGTADRLQVANEDESIRDDFRLEIEDIIATEGDAIIQHTDELLRVMDALESSSGQEITMTAAWSAMKGGFRQPLEPIPAAETVNPAPSKPGTTDTSAVARAAQAAVAKAKVLSQPSEVSGEDGLDPTPTDKENKVLDIRQSGQAALEEMGISSLSELGL